MKLKEQGVVLMDHGSTKTVPCSFYTYTIDKKHCLRVLLNSSEQAWTQGLLDITECQTGYRLTTTGKPVSSSTLKDVDRAMGEFLAEHTFSAIQGKIKEFLKSNEGLNNE